MIQNDYFNSLHYRLGVNCYQHGRGISTPLVHLAVRDGKRMLGYVNLIPGAGRRVEGKTGNAYQTTIIDGYLKDEAVDLGGQLSFRPGYRTLALYFDRIDQDFHFVIVNEDGSGESKRPRRPVAYAPQFNELAGSYTFNRFLQIQPDLIPDSMAWLDPQPVCSGTTRGTMTDCLEVQDHDQLAFGSLVFLDEKIICAFQGEQLLKFKYPAGYGKLVQPIHAMLTARDFAL